MNTKPNLIQRTTDLVLHIVRAYVRPESFVIDATCGNGHDTLALAQMQPWHIFAFDLQEAAIENTRRLLAEHGFETDQPGHATTPGITLVCAGHERMRGYFRQNPPAADGIPGAGASPIGAGASVAGAGAPSAGAGAPSSGFASAILFNLGYLPGGDKALTTRTETTMAAVRDALELLQVGGLLSITMYSGHPEGADEKRALLAFAEGLDSSLWHVSYISMLNQKHEPPEILLISRKR